MNPNYVKLVRESDAKGWTIVREENWKSELFALERNLRSQVDATPRSLGPFYGLGTRRFGQLLASSPPADVGATRQA